MSARPRAAIASRVAFAMLGAFFVSACNAPKREAPKDAPLKLAPVIVVTKTEITYQGKLVSTVEGKLVDGKYIEGSSVDAPSEQPVVHVDATSAFDCDAVAAKVPSVLFALDPGYFNFAAQIRPRVRSSCVEDAWPEPLRRCIIDTAPDALVHDRACSALVPDELATKVATRFGVAPDQVRAMLGR